MRLVMVEARRAADAGASEGEPDAGLNVEMLRQNRIRALVGRPWRATSLLRAAAPAGVEVLEMIASKKQSAAATRRPPRPTLGQSEITQLSRADFLPAGDAP